MLNRFACTVLVAAILAGSGQQASAQDSPLDLFRNDVDVVIRLAQPDRTVERAVELANGVQPGTGGLLQAMAADNLGQVISIPGLIGVDQSSDWYVGVFTTGRDEPRVVFAIPAVETDDVVGALEESYTTAVHGKYVLYTDRGELPPVAGEANSVAKSLSETGRAAFGLGEISVYINVQHLRGVYANEIETAHEQVLEQLNQLRFAIPDDAGLDIGSVVEIYGTLAELFFQAVKDTRSLVVSVGFDKTGLRFEELLEVNPQSKTMTEMAKYPVSELQDLARLPSGAFTYYGIGGGLQELIEWSSGFSLNMIEDEAAREKVRQSFEDLKAIEFGTLVGSLSFGNQGEGILHGASFSQAKPMEKVQEYMRNNMLAMQDISTPGLKQTIEMKTEAEEYGDLKADVMTVTQEYDEDFPGIEISKKIQEIMFGDAGIQSRFLYFEDSYLTVMGGRELTEKALKGPNASDLAQMQAAREKLMEKLTLLVLLDLPGGVAQGLKFVSELDEFPLPIDGAMIDNLNLAPSFIGFGLAVEGNALRARTDIPIEQMQGLFKLSMLFAGVMNQF